VLYTIDRKEEAIASYDKALEFKPDYHETWNNRSVALSVLERYEEAIAGFDKALEFKPDDHSTWVFRGTALFALGRKEEAIASCGKALEFKLNFDYQEAWNYRGFILIGLYLGRLRAYFWRILNRASINLGI
jgi:tetratricopeptide (TPR) repeat protein